MIERLWRWRVALMAVGVTALAALLRFGNLGTPKALVFDELYYARGAYSLLTLGYEADWGDDGGAFARGDFSGLETKGDYVVHPMVGKLLIAAGMKVAGTGPFGYRLAGALLGTLSVLILALLVRRILRSTLWGGVAGLLLAIDGEHIALSRTSILDIFLTFFVLCGFALLWLDRWRAQRIYAAASADAAAAGPGDGWGPRVGVRWWRLAAIVSFGLATGVKWSGAYFAAAFLVIFVVIDALDRRAAGHAHWLAAAWWRSALPGALTTVVVMPAVYVATWANWFLTEGSYGRRWAEEHPGEGVTWLPESLRSLLHYHQSMLDFHTGLDSVHSWEAHPSGWIIQFQPTLFYFERLDPAACGTSSCVSAITSIGNPFIWWAGVAALAYAIWRLLVRREALGMVLAAGVLVGWLPWAPLAHRTIFTFYSVAMAPFVVMVLTWALARCAQPAELEGRFSRVRGLAVGWFLVAVLLVSAYFYPVWVGEPIPEWYRTSHVWFPTW